MLKVSSWQIVFFCFCTVTQKAVFCDNNTLEYNLEVSFSYSIDHIDLLQREKYETVFLPMLMTMAYGN